MIKLLLVIASTKISGSSALTRVYLFVIRITEDVRVDFREMLEVGRLWKREVLMKFSSVTSQCFLRSQL